MDPDNRRLVDFRRRADLLASTATPEVLGQTFASNGTMDDRVKIALTARLLRFRREHPRLFIEGEYLPLAMAASGQEPGLFAFARRVGDEACIAAARVHALAGEEVSRSAEVWLPADMAGAWRSVLTGRRIELVGVASRAAVPQGELVPDGQPCELLFRDNA